MSLQHAVLILQTPTVRLTQMTPALTKLTVSNLLCILPGRCIIIHTAWRVECVFGLDDDTGFCDVDAGWCEPGTDTADCGGSDLTCVNNPPIMQRCANDDCSSSANGECEEPWLCASGTGESMEQTFVCY
jgi:hypothetical protein